MKAHIHIVHEYMNRESNKNMCLSYIGPRVVFITVFMLHAGDRKSWDRGGALLIYGFYKGNPSHNLLVLRWNRNTSS